MHKAQLHEEAEDKTNKVKALLKVVKVTHTNASPEQVIGTIVEVRHSNNVRPLS